MASGRPVVAVEITRRIAVPLAHRGLLVDEHLAPAANGTAHVTSADQVSTRARTACQCTPWRCVAARAERHRFAVSVSDPQQGHSAVQARPRRPGGQPRPAGAVAATPVRASTATPTSCHAPPRAGGPSWPAVMHPMALERAPRSLTHVDSTLTTSAAGCPRPAPTHGSRQVQPLPFASHRGPPGSLVSQGPIQQGLDPCSEDDHPAHHIYAKAQ